MQKKKVFVTRQIPKKGIQLLRKHFLVKVYLKDQTIPRKELLKEVKQCDALLSLLTEKIDQEVLSANPNLKVVSNYAVGYDNVDIKAATSRGIPVCNTPGVLENAVAEHTFALMLALCKRIAEADQFVRAGKYKRWEPMLLLGTELEGK